MAANNASQLKLQLQQTNSKCCCCCYQGIVHKCSLWKSVHIWLISMLIIDAYLVLYGIKNWNESDIAINLPTIVISFFGFTLVILCLVGVYQCNALYILPFRIYLIISIAVLSIVTIFLYVWEYVTGAGTFGCFIIWFVLCWFDINAVYELAKNISNSNISLTQIFKNIAKSVCKTVSKTKTFIYNCFATAPNNSVAAPLNPPNNINNNVPSQNNVQLQISNHQPHIHNNQSNSQNNNSVVWQCFGGSAWENYDPLISQHIESKFKENSVQIFECSIRNIKYIINFNDMTQSNAQPASERQIKRLTINSNNNSNNVNYNQQHPPQYIVPASMVNKQANDNYNVVQSVNNNIASDDYNMQVTLSDEERLSRAMAASLKTHNKHAMEAPPQYRPLRPQHIISESIHNGNDNNDCNKGGRDVIDTAGEQNV